MDSEPRSKLEKRLKMSELNQKQSDEIVNRLESGPRSRIEKKAECWAVGNFSQYRKGLNGKNIVVCENYVEEKNYLACEISLGEDLSTGPLKSHFRSHHHNLFEELIRITNGKKDEKNGKLETENDKGLITDYLKPVESHYYYIAKMMVMDYLPFSFIEKETYRDVIRAYNRKAENISAKKIYAEMVGIKQRLQAIQRTMRSPGNGTAYYLV